MTDPEFRCPWWHYWGWRQTFQRKFYPQTVKKKTQKQIQFIHFHCEMVLQVSVLLGLSNSLKPSSLHYTFINVNVDFFRGHSVQQYWFVPLELASFPTRSTHSSSQPLFQHANSKMHLSEKALQMPPPSVYFAWVLQDSAALLFIRLLIHFIFVCISGFYFIFQYTTVFCITLYYMLLGHSAVCFS